MFILDGRKYKKFLGMQQHNVMIFTEKEKRPYTQEK
jgi:hypothetical protein